MTKPPMRSAYLRRKAVAVELGIDRHTLARLLKRDASFPRFFSISPGIEVIAREDLEDWLRRKQRESRVARLVAPPLTK